jgi:hypothetical protein
LREINNEAAGNDLRTADVLLASRIALRLQGAAEQSLGNFNL